MFHSNNKRSPDRRVPGLALPLKGTTLNRAGRDAKTNYAIPMALPSNPFGGSVPDMGGSLHNKATYRIKGIATKLKPRRGESRGFELALIG